MQNLENVLGHVSAAQKAIVLAGDELKAGLMDAGVHERTFQQLIEANEITGYTALSAALSVQQTLELVTILANNLRQETLTGSKIGWPASGKPDEDD